MRPTPRPTASVATVAAALTFALAGCSSSTEGPTAAQLQEDLDVQAAAQSNLRDQITELEDRLDSRTDAEGAGTAALQERIAAAEDELASLAAELERELTSREDATAEVLASLTALEAEINKVKGTLDGLNTEVAKLREDHELLKRRFENHGH